jgi:hypothetical protein
VLELTDSLLMPCLASEAARFTALIKRLDMNETEAHWTELWNWLNTVKAVVQE